MRKSYIFRLSLLLLALSSCTSYRDVNYFQGTDRTKNVTQSINNYSPLTIQTGDILGININSLNKDADAPFKENTGGYSVDQKGDVHLPQIAPVKVAGLTITQAESALVNGLTVLRQPVVNVRILNFKISVLGDVAKPGVYPVTSERITVIDALSQAGDLTVTAKRDNVLLIREVDGERKFINIDLTANNLFNSPYYYLKNNDVLYIEGSKAKYSSISPFNRALPIILSLVSVAIGVIGIIVINKR